MPGPYAKFQIPAECGCYYPDVKRIMDLKKSDGSYVRILSCELCRKSYEIPLDANKFPRDFIKKLDKEGKIMARIE
ncbi:MAG: hypothetical protein NTY20_03220 [Candidatus Aenigmarchaeota archaeon]|nr:hypothetical protein [Candidatus Aenigmarchaeota archaeon]